MRLAQLLALSLIAFHTPAHAAAPDPRGVWLVEDKTGQIEIESCGGVLWGIVVWERNTGHDTQNPDPSLRGRPTLGMPILLGMRPGGDAIWRGHIYNARDGSTYEANIRPVDGDTLHLEGCVLGGLFCGGQNWTRVKAPGSARGTADVCAAARGVHGY